MSQKLAKYRYSYILLLQLVKTDFKLRYQGSVLGYLWSLFKPLALFTILYIVFVKFLKFGNFVPHAASYLLLGIILWSFFAEVTNSGLTSIVGRGEVLRKISFPRYVIVLSTAASAFINLTLNMVVLAIFMAVQRVDIGMMAIWLPVIILQLVVLSVGMAFLLSALYVRYRDVAHIWEIILQGLFYATPIIYPLNIVADKFAKILLLNPIAQLIQDARYVLITPQTKTLGMLAPKEYYALPIVLTVTIAVVSALYFKRRSKFFAEEI